MTRGILIWVRLALLAAAAVMSWMVMSPWMVLLGILLLGANVVFRERVIHKQVWYDSQSVGWGLSLGIVVSWVWGPGQVFAFNAFFAALSWLIAAGICPRVIRTATGKLNGWIWPTLAWMAGGIFIWLAEAYLQNLKVSFYGGLGFTICFLIGVKRVVPMKGWAVGGVNVLMLLAMGLPLADLVTRRHYQVGEHPDELKRYYSYTVSHKDPDAFARWQEYCRADWVNFEKAVIISDPNGFPHFRLKPNSRGKLFQTDYQINSLGFRGKEISAEKGNVYRVVALGESTTFGLSLTPAHRPWPELLETAIRERLKPEQLVEVINAGVPGATLPENIYRLEHEILALKPDLIISYHGYNGFYLLNSALPAAHGKPPPLRIARASRLLADAEYSVKLSWYKRNMGAGSFFQSPSFSKPMETSYADAYRKLIEIAATSHISLALANFSMAVNSKSDPDVIEFYRRGWPIVHAQIRANEAHSLMIEELCRQHPDISFINTHPHLDGEYEKFIDLVHFDPDGDWQLAETIFDSIKPLIQKETVR